MLKSKITQKKERQEAYSSRKEKKRNIPLMVLLFFIPFLLMGVLYLIVNVGIEGTKEVPKFAEKIIYIQSPSDLEKVPENIQDLVFETPDGFDEANFIDGIYVGNIVTEYDEEVVLSPNILKYFYGETDDFSKRISMASYMTFIDPDKNMDSIVLNEKLPYFKYLFKDSLFHREFFEDLADIAYTSNPDNLAQFYLVDMTNVDEKEYSKYSVKGIVPVLSYHINEKFIISTDTFGTNEVYDSYLIDSYRLDLKRDSLSFFYQSLLDIYSEGDYFTKEERLKIPDYENSEFNARLKIRTEGVDMRVLLENEQYYLSKISERIKYKNDAGLFQMPEVN